MSKSNANALVRKALKNGTLEKQRCTVCGSPKTVAHHDDYNQPLNVIWLCHSHHRLLHGLMTPKPLKPPKASNTKKRKSDRRGGARPGAGRPTDAVRVTVTTRIKETAHDRLKDEARARNTSVSKVIADHLENP